MSSRALWTNLSNPILASAARTTTGQSAAFAVGSESTLDVFIDVTAATGTGPSMTVNVEWSVGDGKWYTADPVDAFSAITTTGQKCKQFAVKGLQARLNYVISGTTPSFTFSAYAVIGA